MLTGRARAFDDLAGEELDIASDQSADAALLDAGPGEMPDPDALEEVRPVPSARESVTNGTRRVVPGCNRFQRSTERASSRSSL